MARGTRKQKEPEIEPYRPGQCARRCGRKAVLCTMGMPGFKHEHICMECYIAELERNGQTIRQKGGTR